MALKTGFCGLGFGVEAATGAPSGFGGSAIMDCGSSVPGSCLAVETLVSWNVTWMRIARIFGARVLDSANDLRGNFLELDLALTFRGGGFAAPPLALTSWKGYSPRPWVRGSPMPAYL
jgi:hypothetical protein